jgi:hypothetical protein
MAQDHGPQNPPEEYPGQALGLPRPGTPESTADHPKEWRTASAEVRARKLERRLEALAKLMAELRARRDSEQGR